MHSKARERQRESGREGERGQSAASETQQEQQQCQEKLQLHPVDKFSALFFFISARQGRRSQAASVLSATRPHKIYGFGLIQSLLLAKEVN